MEWHNLHVHSIHHILTANKAKFSVIWSLSTSEICQGLFIICNLGIPIHILLLQIHIVPSTNYRLLLAACHPRRVGNPFSRDSCISSHTVSTDSSQQDTPSYKTLTIKLHIDTVTSDNFWYLCFGVGLL